MNLRIRLFLPYCLTVVLWSSTVVSGHEYEDGYVERAVEVVIRDDVATIKYFMGLNETTMSQAAEAWRKATKTTDTEAIEAESAPEFAELVLGQIQSELKLELDGKPVVLLTPELSPSTKHHFSFIASFTFKLPKGRALELSLLDETFQEMDSTARYSLKGLGATMVLKSNVAPIIIRAKRHELGKMTAQERVETCKIAATVAIAPIKFKKEDTVD